MALSWSMNKQIKLSFQETGDSLFFDIINLELAHWFVQTSQRLGNRYSLGDQVVDEITRSNRPLIDEEIDYVNLVNQQLEKLKIPTFELPTDWHDQKQLNKLHKDWGETRIKWPKLTKLFYKLDPRLFQAYQEMNCHIHFIENSFRWTFRDPTHWRESNPFKDVFYEWQVCHLYIMYPGHGREAFEKFRNMDTYDDIYRDNVNWDNIDSALGINLVRPFKMTPPEEFLVWCQEKNLVPHREYTPLANLTDWEKNITMARQIIAKNVKIKNNYFCLEIVN